MLRTTCKALKNAQKVVQPFSQQQTRGVAFWKNVEMGPKDPILGVTQAFQADPFEGKVSVGVGAYRDDNGKPFVLPSVREAEARVVAKNMNMEYSPIIGVPAFVEAATNLAYGADSDAVQNKKVAALQSLSGTGALKLVAQFIATHGNNPTVLLPNPSWGNHTPIFRQAGCKTKTYRYWDEETLGLDFEGMLTDLKNEPPATVLLHACAHNPTGVDPSTEQWQRISDVCKEAGHFIIFDNAYQGFASGDTNKDVAAVRHFIDEGHNIALCQSFAKNFGLYGQRIGNFSIKCEDADEAARVSSQLQIIARAAYSNPPVHGARIVETILNDEALKSQWQGEIKEMSGRIIDMRALLKQNLSDVGSKLNWDHITNQIGMFSYTGLTKAQCEHMTSKHHIYLTMNGRISMAGVTTKNAGALAEAMHDATK